jgi:hypothetical protein
MDLGALRRTCDTPVIGRVRAVLSWGTPPSTVDPDALPHWGNVRCPGLPLRLMVDRRDRRTRRPDPTHAAHPCAAAGQQTSLSGQACSVDLSALPPCGYVVRLGVTDRALVNSAGVGRTVHVDVGLPRLNASSLPRPQADVRLPVGRAS